MITLPKYANITMQMQNVKIALTIGRVSSGYAIPGLMKQK
jgi:hypothetical protein